MFEPCLCGTGGKNTGIPSCVPTIERIALLILVPTWADDGTLNSIKKSDFVNGVLPDAFVLAKINHLDPSKKWSPTPKINTVTDVRDAPVTFDVDGIATFVSQGVRTFLGSYYKKNGVPTFAGVLNSFQCIDTSYFEVTVEGAIAGIDNDTELLPIAIETGTLYAGVVKGTKTDPNSVSLTFAIQELVRDENLIQIAKGSLETNMLLVRGLLQLTGEALALPVITTTTARINLNFIYGNFPSKNAFEGAVAADLSADYGVTPSTVFNETTSAQLAIASLIPVVGEPGLYDMTIAAGASGDKIKVSIFKTGYELTSFTYLIP